SQMAAKKKTRKGTGRAVSTVAAQERGWNGAARFQAIAPVFGRILELQQAAAVNYAPAATEAFALSAAADREIQQAVASAAKDSGASEAQIRAWVESFNSLG